MNGLAAGWLTIFVSVVLPLGFFVYLLVRRRGQLPAFGMGLATFALAELCVCIPLFRFLAGVPALAANPVVYTLLLALCAALLEGLARWLAFTFVLRRRRGLPDGVSLGVAHGGLGTAISGFAYLLSALYFPVVLQGQSFGSIAVAAVESILTLAMQVAVTLLILRSVRQTKPLYLLLGILGQALFRAVAAFSLLGLGDWALQAVLALVTLALLAFAAKSRNALAGGGYQPPAREKSATVADPGSLDENIWKN